jgi:hypothetical protein
MVKPRVWKASGMADWGGCLCIGCLEKRIGRQLTPKDFLPNHPFNRDDYPASDRLLHRRSGEPVMLVNRQEGLCLVVEGTRIAIQRDGKTWVSLEPGWKVTGDLDLTIERDGKVWVP